MIMELALMMGPLAAVLLASVLFWALVREEWRRQDLKTKLMAMPHDQRVREIRRLLEVQR